MEKVRNLLGKEPPGGDDRDNMSTILKEVEEMEGCNFGKATRTIVVTLLTLMGLFLALAGLLVKMNATANADTIRALAEQVKKHDGQIADVSLQGTRIEERVVGIQGTLLRIERKIEGGPRP